MCSKLYDEAETKKPQSIAVFLNFNVLKYQQMHHSSLSPTQNYPFINFESIICDK